jgi:predicted DNA-binding antitoxin AbrB/MazE fold protein
MKSLHCASGLRYNGCDIDPGAQTGRPGDTGPVRDLLGGLTSPAAVVLLLVPFDPHVRAGILGAAVVRYSGRAAAVSITVEAVYENGSLKLSQTLPLQEHDKVHVTVHVPVAVPEALAAVQNGYGLLRWTEDAETLRHVAEDDEFGILESP